LPLPPPPPGTDWASVRAWRAQLRRELIAQRLTLEPQLRAARAAEARRHLAAELARRSVGVLGIYWPVRGEIDVRELARSHLGAGGRVVLPAVIKKGAPVQFRGWQPDAPMTRDACSIPVPSDPELLEPDALIVPLVGFDAQRYRLGYGGGYYDRTLASLERRPVCIGLGFQSAQLASILPQPHDIAMDVIITDAGMSGGQAP
jgi:5-formyltetrahydrofolate cyclo-ligase